MRKMLITGGAGFIGRHLCKYILDQGAMVNCVDNLAPLTGGINPYEGWFLFSPLDYSNFIFFKMDCREANVKPMGRSVNR